MVWPLRQERPPQCWQLRWREAQLVAQTPLSATHWLRPLLRIWRPASSHKGAEQLPRSWSWANRISAMRPRKATTPVRRSRNQLKLTCPAIRASSKKWHNLSHRLRRTRQRIWVKLSLQSRTNSNAFYKTTWAMFATPSIKLIYRAWGP